MADDEEDIVVEEEEIEIREEDKIYINIDKKKEEEQDEYVPSEEDEEEEEEDEEEEEKTSKKRRKRQRSNSDDEDDEEDEDEEGRGGKGKRKPKNTTPIDLKCDYCNQFPLSTLLTCMECRQSKYCANHVKSCASIKGFRFDCHGCDKKIPLYQVQFYKPIHEDYIRRARFICQFCKTEYPLSDLRSHLQDDCELAKASPKMPTIIKKVQNEIKDAKKKASVYAVDSIKTKAQKERNVDGVSLANIHGTRHTTMKSFALNF